MAVPWEVGTHPGIVEAARVSFPITELSEDSMDACGQTVELPGVAVGVCASGVVSEVRSPGQTNELPGVAVGVCASGVVSEVRSPGQTNELPGVAVGVCASGVVSEVRSPGQTN